MASLRVNIVFIATFALCGFAWHATGFSSSVACWFDWYVLLLVSCVSERFSILTYIHEILQYPLGYNSVVVLRGLLSDCLVGGMLSSLYVSVPVHWFKWIPMSFSYLPGFPVRLWLVFRSWSLANVSFTSSYGSVFPLSPRSHVTHYVFLLGLFILLFEVLSLLGSCEIPYLDIYFDSWVFAVSRFMLVARNCSLDSLDFYIICYLCFAASL